MNKQGEYALEILALKNTKYIFKPTIINNVVSLKTYHKENGIAAVSMQEALACIKVNTS